MATLVLDRTILEEGAFPAVCVKTGRPSDATFEVRQDVVPGWSYLLAPMGLLPFLVAGWFVHDGIAANLSVHSGALARWRVARRIGVVMAPAGAVVLVLATLTAIPALATAGAAITVVGLAAYLLSLLGLVSLERVQDGGVRLHRVHRRFAAAVRDHHQPAE